MPAISTFPAAPRAFYGPSVVRAAFVLAFFAWGLGFYAPPIFAHAVAARLGLGTAWMSAMLTLHYVSGAFVVAQLPRLHARVGLARTTFLGACALSLGLAGWALATSKAQLLVAVLCSGAGWVAMAAAPVNAFISRWYARGRPQALARAFNGASFGGVVFSPLLSWLILRYGFTAGVLACVGAMWCVVAVLCWRVLRKTPAQLGQQVDGVPAATGCTKAAATPRLPGALLWRHRGFRSLALAVSLSLFAQTGLVAHLYGLFAQAEGVQAAGWLMGLATACAILGRSVVARVLRRAAAPRAVAVATYAMQCVGTLALLAAGGAAWPWLLPGVVLFGLGIGNATSLPPLVAQAEFEAADTPRVVALTVALSQGTWAFAPLLLGAVLAIAGASATLAHGAAGFFCVVALLQAGAAVVMASGLKAGRAGAVFLESAGCPPRLPSDNPHALADRPVCRRPGIRAAACSAHGHTLAA